MIKGFENMDPNKIKQWFDSLPEKRKYEIHQVTRITYNSCAIEGNSLTENETFNLIVKHLFQQETQNRFNENTTNEEN